MSVAEKSLSVIQGGAMPILNVSNEQKLTAIRDTVAKGANDAEFTMLMHLANTYQLDPFLKEIWFIKYGNTPTIMVSRDGLRNYAMRQDDFIDMMSQEVRKGDTFKFDPITGEIHHEISDGSGPITKCYCIIKRDGKSDHTEIIDFKEYYDALSGKNGVWKSHPSAMGKKTVEVLAFKKCYTITGLYAPEEMGLQEVDAKPTTIDASYKVGSIVDESRPDPKEQWLESASNLKKVAVDKSITDIELRDIGERETGSRDPRKWTTDDMQRIETYITSFDGAGEAATDVQRGTNGTTDDGLPSDDDLPF